MNKEKNIKNIRNIGIIAHIDAGKTTVTERILYYTGKSHRLGEVHNGEAVMDWMRDEQERGITITSAVTTCTWKEKNIQIIDTPGHVDFTIEVERSLRILDGAIGIFCAVGGVEPQSETVWLQANKYKIPKIAFINKLDRIGANIFNTIKMMKKKLNITPLLLQIPIYKKEKLSGIVDLIKMAQIEWDESSKGINYTINKINIKAINKSKIYRDKLIETIAEYDDKFMEKYLNNDIIKKETIIKLIRTLTITLQLVPIFCGSALKNKGIQPLIDGIINFLPSPIDGPPTTGISLKNNKEIKFFPKKKSPLAALIFKISIIEGRKISFARIYQGQIINNEKIFNSSQNKTEKNFKILTMHANKKKIVKEANPGDIIGIIGLKHSFTGDTLCNKDNQILLEKIETLDPVVSIAIEGKTYSDQVKIKSILENFTLEDPTIKVKESKETGQIILSGMGELHLEIIISRMSREFNVKVNTGTPEIVYKETITKEITIKEKIDEEINGEHYYAEIELKLKPMPRTSGNTIELEKYNKTIPKEILNLIKAGLLESLETGTILGYPVVDTKITLLNVNIPENFNSNILAYKIVTIMASKKGLKLSKPCLLAPIMKIKITTPEEFTGEVISDLNSRKGIIKSIESDIQINIIKGTIPLIKTFGYTTTLRSITQGKAKYNINFLKFDINN